MFSEKKVIGLQARDMTVAKAQMQKDGGILQVGSDPGEQKGFLKTTLKVIRSFRKVPSMKENSSDVGTGARLDGKSFGLFDINHPARKFVFKAVYNQNTEYTLAAIIIAHLVVLILLSEESSDVLKGLDITIIIVYTIESLLRMFALGFVLGPNSYLRNVYNQLEFVIVVSSWGFLILRSTGFDENFRLDSLRALRLILCLRHLKGVASLLAVMQTIGESLPLLVSVIDFTLMFGFFYGLVGVSLFGGSFRRRCGVPAASLQAFALGFQYENASTAIYTTIPAELCGTVTDGTIQTTKGFKCPMGLGGVEQICTDQFRNPNFGYTNLDDFAATMLTLFQCLTLENWDEIMFDNIDSEYSWSSVYYLTFVIIGSYFLLSTFVAAFSGVFLRLRKEHQALAELARMKRMKAFIAAGKVGAMGASFLKKVRRASNAINEKPTDKKEEAIPEDEEVFHQDPADLVPATCFGRFAKSFLLTLRSNVRTFHIVANTIILANLLLLMIYSHDMSWKDNHTMLQSVFIVIFVIELYLRCLIFDPWYGFFFQDTLGNLNCFDIMIVFFSAIGVFTGQYKNLTMLRFFRLFIDEKQLGNIQKLLKSLSSMVTLFLFFFIVLLFYSIIGMQLYSGHFNYDNSYAYSSEEGGVLIDQPRENFDTFGKATLTMFGVTTSERWVNVMWNAMRSSRFTLLAPIYFVPFFIFENFIVLNLIVAVVLDALDFDEKKKKQMQEEMTIKKMKYVIPTSVIMSKVLDNYVPSLGVLAPISTCFRGFKSMLDCSFCFSRGGSKISSPTGGKKRRASRDGGTKLSRGHSRTKKKNAWMENNNTDEAPNPGRKSRVRMQSRIVGRASMAGGSIVNVRKANRQSNKSLIGGSVLLRGTAKHSHKAGIFEVMVSGNIITLQNQFTQHGEDPSLAGIERFLNSRWVETLVVAHNQKEEIKDVQQKAVEGVRAIKKELKIEDNIEKDLKETKRKERNKDRRSLTFEDYVHSLDTLNMTEPENWFGVEIIPSDSYELPVWMDDTTLGLFDMTHPVRYFVENKMLRQLWYQYLSVGIVLISVIGVFLEEPVGRENEYKSMISAINVVCFFFFMFELIFKFIANGIIFTPYPYFLDTWNILDFFLLLIDFMGMYEYEDEQERLTRMLLCLRPMRLFNRVDGLRELAVYLNSTLKTILKLLGLAIVIFLMFSIIALQYFGGRFSYCTDVSATGRIDCTGNYIDPSGILKPRVWLTPEHNFDWFGKGVLTLFEIATLDEWVDVMYAAMDITNFNVQPALNNSSVNAVFFVLFICIGSMFIIRAFIGVFIDQFGLASGSKLLTEKQKLFRDLHRIVAYMKAIKVTQRPQGESFLVRIRKKCFDAVHSEMFRKAIVAIVLVNCAFIASQHADQSDAWFNMLNLIDALFVAIYLVEQAAKMFAEGPVSYFTSKWNIFEGILVLSSILCLFPAQGSFRLQVGRPFRFLRVFRIVRYLNSLKKVMNRILVTLPSLINIITLQMMVIIVYAGIATQVFADVKFGLYVNRKVNFETFSSSFLILFHSMTGEGWRQIMNDLKLDTPYCTEDLNGDTDCGSPFGSTAFFVTYIILCNYILTNLFVATILDYVSFGILKGNYVLSDEHLDEYQEVWSAFDPLATGFIKLHYLWDLLDKIGAPLVQKNMSGRTKRLIFYEVLAVHDKEHGVPMKALVEILILKRLGMQSLTSDVLYDRRREVENALIQGAATTIQAHYKGFCVRTKYWRKNI